MTSILTRFDHPINTHVHVLIIQMKTPIMKLHSTSFILLTAKETLSAARLLHLPPPTFTCNATAYKSANCTGQQLGHYVFTPLDWFELRGCQYHKDLMECCVGRETLLYALGFPPNITGFSFAFLSCSRDEMPIYHHGGYYPVLEVFILVVIPLMVLLLAVWCGFRCYRQSKQATLEQQPGHDDEEATVPDDDSLSMVSI